jgi:hypothetical protein
MYETVISTNFGKNIKCKGPKWPENLVCMRYVKFTHNLAGYLIDEFTVKVKEDHIKLLQLHVLLLSEK